jgi:hypothetical protein
MGKIIPLPQGHFTVALVILPGVFFAKIHSSSFDKPQSKTLFPRKTIISRKPIEISKFL